MGMYTEIHFNAELKKDVPDNVIAILKYMVGDTDTSKHPLGIEPDVLPDHELFSCDRWSFMLQCDSYYFSADTHSTLRYDEISKSYFLCIRSNVKNYDNEIHHFIDWIHPYLDEFEGDYLGHYRYEENVLPTLIFRGRTLRPYQDQLEKFFTVWEEGSK